MAAGSRRPVIACVSVLLCTACRLDSRRFGFATWTTPRAQLSTAIPRYAAATGSPSNQVPTMTYVGINTFALNIGSMRLLVDPLLVGDLVFFGQSWAFKGSRRDAAVRVGIRPEDVVSDFDAIILTQGLEDHTHIPTLQQVDRRMPVVASPTAAKVCRNLGFQAVTELAPGREVQLGPHLQVTATPGSVVGPPWEDPENGYVFTDLRPGGMAVGIEPHGNFLGPALGTSLKMLPRPPNVHVDALVMPLTSQTLAGCKLVNGVREAIDTLNMLRKTPRFVLPLKNGDLNANGILAEALKEDGGRTEFIKRLQRTPALKGVKVLDVHPGIPVQIL